MQIKRNRETDFHFKIFAAVLTLLCLLLLLKPVMKVVYPVKYVHAIEKYSAFYALDKHLVMGIISAESQFDENAQSHKAAKGLMQLRDETALWCIDQFGINAEPENIYEPEVNINIGCCYLRYLLDRFSGNTDTALAAYNAGEGNVSEWLSDSGGTPGNARLTQIPFDETENYITTVKNREKIYKYLY